MNAKLKIAICGTRGIPACYGGFETFAEEISKRLVERGHQVRVYGRKHVISYDKQYYNGAEIVLLYAPKHKYLETVIHSFLSFIHLLKNKVDVVLVCNGANSPMIWIPRFLGGMPVVVNVDGIERNRGKWNILGRLWYRLGEICSVYLSNSFISDADVIRDYYQDTYKRASVVIPYGHREIEKNSLEKKLKGTKIEILKGQGMFDELGIESNKYLLYVSRLEPENNAHIVIKAYNQIKSAKMPLVIVGDAPYANEYKSYLKSIAGDGVVFAGFRFGDSYQELQKNAYLYIQATEVGGTHPALVEAMGYANCILVNSTPENLEVVSDTAIAYDFNCSDSLAEKISVLLSNQDLLIKYRNLAYNRAKMHYSWDKITLDYEQFLSDLTRKNIKTSNIQKIENIEKINQ